MGRQLSFSQYMHNLILNSGYRNIRLLLARAAFAETALEFGCFCPYIFTANVHAETINKNRNSPIAVMYRKASYDERIVYVTKYLVGLGLDVTELDEYENIHENAVHLVVQKYLIDMYKHLTLRQATDMISDAIEEILNDTSSVVANYNAIRNGAYEKGDEIEPRKTWPGSRASFFNYPELKLECRWCISNCNMDNNVDIKKCDVLDLSREFVRKCGADKFFSVKFDMDNKIIRMNFDKETKDPFTLYEGIKKIFMSYQVLGDKQK